MRWSLLLSLPLWLNLCVCLAAEELPTDQQTEDWIDALASKDELVRERGAESLLEAVSLALERSSEVGHKADDSATRFREILRKSCDKLSEAIRSTVPKNDIAPLAAMMCLASSTDDGADLRSVLDERTVRGDAEKELLGIYVLATTLPMTLPGNKSILEVLLPEIEDLSFAGQDHLNALWREIEEQRATDLMRRPSAVGPLVAAFASLSQTFIVTDRTSLEIPLVVKCLDSKYPNLFRLLSIRILSELSEESTQALSKLYELTNEESALIRRAAVRAIFTIEAGKSDASELGTRANLSDEDLRSFVDWAKKFESTIDYRRRETVIAGALNSPYVYYQRKGLRLALEFGAPKNTASRIRELLQSPDQITRNVAQKVTEKLE